MNLFVPYAIKSENNNDKNQKSLHTAISSFDYLIIYCALLKKIDIFRRSSRE